jgi:hypothetical protein
VGISKTTTVGQSVFIPYEETFFTTDLSVTAGACTALGCEVMSKNGTDEDTLFDGSGTVTVSYETGTVTANGSGFVTIRFLDANNNEISSTQDSFSGTGDADQSHSFTVSVPSGATQIELERSVVADSQPFFGDSCTADKDCTSEESTLTHPITVSG